jgi:hypothetical protein
MSDEIRQNTLKKKKSLGQMQHGEYTQLRARQNKNSTKPEQMV